MPRECSSSRAANATCVPPPSAAAMLAIRCWRRWARLGRSRIAAKYGATAMQLGDRTAKVDQGDSVLQLESGPVLDWTLIEPPDLAVARERLIKCAPERQSTAVHEAKRLSQLLGAELDKCAAYCAASCTTTHQWSSSLCSEGNLLLPNRSSKIPDLSYSLRGCCTCQLERDSLWVGGVSFSSSLPPPMPSPSDRSSSCELNSTDRVVYGQLSQTSPLESMDDPAGQNLQINMMTSVSKQSTALCLAPSQDQLYHLVMGGIGTSVQVGATHCGVDGTTRRDRTLLSPGGRPEDKVQSAWAMLGHMCSGRQG
jgi:hypothetical protein